MFVYYKSVDIFSLRDALVQFSTVEQNSWSSFDRFALGLFELLT